MQNAPQPNIQAPAAALAVPTREQALNQTIEHLAHSFGRNEQIWVISRKYDPDQVVWLVDVVRRGSMARWVRQRYRYDAQAETLYFMGERILSSAELAEARRTGTLFPIIEK